MNSYTVLAIDDDPTFNFLVEKSFFIMDQKVKCVTCDHAFDAIDYLQKAYNGQYSFPDLMLVDINMPLKNGFEFIEDYEKSFASMNKNCVIYFLSSSTRESDRTKALKYESVTGFYTKDHISTITKDVWNRHFMDLN